MANLEQIMAETSKTYDNSRNALQSQIDAIAGNLEAQKGRINADYAQQARSLDDQRNFQAQASSMAASRNGGSFGGTSEIANKKFYQQAYVPAVTQMQTNRANDISNAESQANSNRLSLQQTLAQLNDEANRYALQRYDNAVEAERQAAQRAKELAAQQAYQNYLNQAAQQANKYGAYTDTAGGTQFYNTGTNKGVTFGTFANGAGATGSGNLMALASNYLNNDDYARLSRIVNAQSNTKHAGLKATTAANYQNKGYLSQEDNDFMRRLGLTF